MRYEVFGPDGISLGSTDLDGLGQWLRSGRISENDKVIDKVGKCSTTVARILEHDMAVGLVAGKGIGAPTIAPPGSLDRKLGVTRPGEQSSAIAGIALRVGLAVALGIFTPMGGFVVSILTLIYAFRVMRNKDPNGLRCLIWALIGMVGIFIWTYVKISNNVTLGFGTDPLINHPQKEEPEPDDGQG